MLEEGHAKTLIDAVALGERLVRQGEKGCDVRLRRWEEGDEARGRGGGVSVCVRFGAVSVSACENVSHETCDAGLLRHITGANYFDGMEGSLYEATTRPGEIAKVPHISSPGVCAQRLLHWG